MKCIECTYIILLLYLGVVVYFLKCELRGSPAAEHHHFFEPLVVEEVGEGPQDALDPQFFRHLIEDATVGLAGVLLDVLKDIKIYNDCSVYKNYIGLIY